MPEFRRPRHRAVWRVLESLNAKALARANCLFGGGTRIALELNEYRESEDMDFICCDITGYRSLRASIGEHSLGELMPKAKSGVSLLRNVRADQYGIRTILSVDGEPVKFEIILEARIQVAAATLKEISVPVLDHVSCFAEKWLANADRWNDKSVLAVTSSTSHLCSDFGASKKHKRVRDWRSALTAKPSRARHTTLAPNSWKTQPTGGTASKASQLTIAKY